MKLNSIYNICFSDEQFDYVKDIRPYEETYCWRNDRLQRVFYHPEGNEITQQYIKTMELANV